MKWPGFLQPLVDLASTDARGQRKAAGTRLRAPVEPVERSIALDGRPVDYLLVRRRGRRGVGLKIDGNGMTVAASLTTPITAIEDLIGKNSSWVLKKLGEWSHRKITLQRWETGATVSFMGEPLTLMIDAGAAKTKVEQAQSHLFVHVKAALGDVDAIAAQAETAVANWYNHVLQVTKIPLQKLQGYPISQKKPPLMEVWDLAVNQSPDLHSQWMDIWLK